MVTSPVWIIAGPTASGKSALAAQLAAACGGVVINADSMQVYAEIPILSAQPSAAERDVAPHVLYGFRSMMRPYSAAAWAADAAAAIADAHNNNQQPILVGGSGLYLRALTSGFSPMPPVPENIRRDVTELYDALGPDKFHMQLAARDPDMAARLHPTDRQRCIRAREVFEATGTALSSFQKMPADNIAPHLRYRAVILDPPRPWLHARIDARFRHMVKNGALDEARAINVQKPASSLPGTRALGLGALRDHAAGYITLDEAIDQAMSQSRQYAKRQSTWFRGQVMTRDTVFIDTPDTERAASYLRGEKT